MLACGFVCSVVFVSKGLSSAPGLKLKVGKGAVFGLREGLLLCAVGDRGGEVVDESRGGKTGAVAGSETEVIVDKAATPQYKNYCCSGQQAGAIRTIQGVPAPE